ncbi:hypothetical protein K435DRAFT_865455 [Dendrothele bispora CBS 962.96]|uniref:Uncharacterized protein n=1 Tax=Dendrothele bispora (strain CBS 962.96) TaxID=1314807 RepID=A0A4S8LJR8_DENBC|nr:hypothetical protein K435DRAFT_865455 [Dendrothele bispora CBS 962.96]
MTNYMVSQAPAKVSDELAKTLKALVLPPKRALKAGKTFLQETLVERWTKTQKLIEGTNRKEKGISSWNVKFRKRGTKRMLTNHGIREGFRRCIPHGRETTVTSDSCHEAEQDEKEEYGSWNGHGGMRDSGIVYDSDTGVSDEK